MTVFVIFYEQWGLGRGGRAGGSLRELPGGFQRVCDALWIKK